MKKIGILTFHSAINNGAVLQAYALVQAFKSVGVDAEDIDYTSDKIKKSYYIPSLTKRRSLKSILLYFLQDTHMLKTQKKFREFVDKYLCISTDNYDNNIEFASGKYDILVAGSDQVWNTELTGDDFNYFFSFDNNTKKCSYAASIGREITELEMIRNIKKNLSFFNIISVREDDARNLLKDKMGINSVVAPDPVFLIEKQQWINDFSLKLDTKRYILFFMLHKNEEMIKFAQKLSQKTGLPIYCLTNSFNTIKQMRNIKEFGPLDFLQSMYSAEYVVTDSFHAFAISLIFNKEVYVGLKTGALSSLNSRIVNLAIMLGVSNRLIGNETSDSKINYIEVNKKISEQRELGMSLIKKITEV